MTAVLSDVDGPPISGDPISGDPMDVTEVDAAESTPIDEEPESDAPGDPAVGDPDVAQISPPDPPPVRVPEREDPVAAGERAFLAWWDANAAFVDDDAELFALLEWRAQIHQDIIRRLYYQRSALLIQWRSEGLTLQQIAERSGLSYARVYELMPKHLRGRRPAVDRGTDGPSIGAPDSRAVGSPDEGEARA